MGSKKDFLRYKRYVNKLINTKNKIDHSFYNGVFTRYKNPILTSDHFPIEWRFDLNERSNPHYIERLGINATFNAGAIYRDGYFYLMVRCEGTDRKSFFALAKSKNGIDHFTFERVISYPDIDPEETNAYDMRLVQHEDGFIYGIYCSECKDLRVNDTSSAIAKVGLLRSKDLVNWERLPNIKFSCDQQRNVVLHPEFINGKYAFYTRPQEGFIDVGSGGGIGFAYVSDIMQPTLEDEVIVDSLKYHTIYELKNGEGPAPIKTEKGWIHFAHGVRNTANGLRYVLYAYMTSLEKPWEIISKPSGYLLAPQGLERIGDVSNVLFTNGVVLKDNIVYLYYASSDTRMHVATCPLPTLLDYMLNNPKEMFRSLDSVNQRLQLIERNKNNGN